MTSSSSDSESDYERQENDMTVEMVFKTDFTCAVDEERITVTDAFDQIYYFAHPTGERTFFVKPRSTKLTIGKVILKERHGNDYIGNIKISLVLDFPDYVQLTAFTGQIEGLLHRYKRV